MNRRLEERLRLDAARYALDASLQVAARPLAKLRTGKPLTQDDRAALVELLDVYQRCVDPKLSEDPKPTRAPHRPPDSGTKLPPGVGDAIAWLIAAGVTQAAAIRTLDPRASKTGDEDANNRFHAIKEAHRRFRKRGAKADPRRAVAALDALRNVTPK